MIKLAILFEKQAFNLLKNAGDIFVYTFVPQKAIDLVKEKGLLSGKLVAANPEALKAARNTKKKQDDFKKNVEEDLSNKDLALYAESVSAFFTLPDFSKLPKSHFIYKWDLIPIQINLSQLMREQPKTTLLGVELAPYDEKASKEENINKREKKLTLKEVEKYISQGAENFGNIMIQKIRNIMRQTFLICLFERLLLK